MLRERLKVLAKARRRFGYRRLNVFLRRQGHEVNHKRLFRIYREEQLHVRCRGGRKRAVGTFAQMVLPLRPNQRWSLDFVSDQLTDGRRFRIMAVVDDCTRECLALIADTSLSGARVARELATLLDTRGKPQTEVSDNVVGVLVEVPVMLSLVWFANRTRHWFPAEETPIRPRAKEHG